MNRKYDDRLKDYTDVKERIRLFYEKHPDGRLSTTDIRVTNEPDGTPRVIVEAAAWRTPDDPIPGKGSSWMILPGSTPYTRGSELENTETSAWGRAIGALGIGIAGGIGSADEIAAKAGEGERKAGMVAPGTELPKPGPATVAGTADCTGKQSPIDCQLRTDPEKGAYIGFRLIASDRKRTQVVMSGPLAEAFWTAIGHDAAQLHGKEVTVEGTREWLEFTDKEGRTIQYPRVNAERIVAPDWTLPAPDEAESEPLPWAAEELEAVS